MGLRAASSWGLAAKELFLPILARLGERLPSQGVAILIYHSLDDSGSPISCPPKVFARQLEYLRRAGYRALQVSEIWSLLAAGGTAERVVGLTFDDGFETVYTRALPLLQRFGYTATVFACSAYLGRRCQWVKHPAIPEWPIMTVSQLGAAREAGMEIGAHTHTHARLPQLSEEAARAEIEASKATLEDVVGAAVDSFAYTYGAVDERAVALVRGAGFRTAYTNRPGLLRAHLNPFMLPRFPKDKIRTRTPGGAVTALRIYTSGGYDRYCRLKRATRFTRAAEERE